MTERQLQKAVLYVNNPLRKVIEAVVSNNVGFQQDSAREILTRGDLKKQNTYESFGLTPHLSWLRGQAVLPPNDLERRLPMFTRCETLIIETPVPPSE